MALPSGYTRLAYIKSTGTQYFDTKHVAAENTKLVAELSVDDVSTTRNIFGATDGVFLFNSTGANKIEVFYGNSHFTITTSNPITEKFTFEVSSSAIKVNGVTMKVPSYSSFSNSTNILFGTRQGGAASARGHITLYSCKIYHNGIMLRDFVPCRNASGTVGLYDTVNSEFYTNAGSGTFGYGEIEPSGDHRTMVDGVIWGVPSGRCLAGGVGYSIQKGRTMVDGVGYDVKFGGLSIGDLEVGASVYATFNGGRTEFLVVQQGLPSNLYDVSCDGTWLLPRYVYAALQQWHTSSVNDYKASNIHKFINNTYFQLFDSGMQSIIKTVKIPYVNGNGNAAIATGASGLETKMFLLSGYEVGFTTGTNWHFPVDGARLSYFLEGSAADANAKRAGYRGPGNSIGWALRSASMQTTNSVMGVANGGAWTSLSATNSIGARPAFILDSGTDIDPETFDILV